MTERLSPEMVNCLEYATAGGGTIIRFPGGFWRTDRQSPVSYGTPTIAALVKRGKMDYSEWKEGRNGRFPVAATIRQ